MALLREYKPIAVLSIETIENNHLIYRLRAGIEDSAQLPLSAIKEAKQLALTLDSLFFSPDTRGKQVRVVAEKFTASALPDAIRSQLEQWVSADPWMDSTLVIRADLPEINDLPWELLPMALDLDFFVVHLTDGSKATQLPNLKKARLLLVGWPMLPGGSKLEGVVREVGQIAARFHGESLNIEAMLSPERADLAKTMAAVKPHIVHLAVANGFEVDLDNLSSRFLLGLKSGAVDSSIQSFETLTDEELVTLLDNIDELALCVVNTMPNPVVGVSSIYRKLSVELGVAVVGWAGAIQDTIAFEFALYWYQRLLEGNKLQDAMRSFTRQYSNRQWVLGAMPVVWLPSEEWLGTPVLQLAAIPATISQPITRSEKRLVKPTKAAPSFSDLEPQPLGPTLLINRQAAAPVSIYFEPQPSLFPSLLINRQPAVQLLTLDADAEMSARIEIVCDTGGRTSAFRATRLLKTGRNSIDMRNIEFPVLYDLIESDERRIVNFEVSVWVEDVLVGQETQSVQWRARREWLSSEEALPYVPSFVVPMSQAVTDLIRDAERVLSQIGHPRDRFSGYCKNQAERTNTADLQMKAIFQALRDRELKYITPPGSPVYVPNPTRLEIENGEARNVTDNLSSFARISGQLVRLPDDIVQRGHGTCHDLALFLAAAAEYVNLRPLLVLLPGHTFFGFWLDHHAHDDFWKVTRGLRLESISDIGRLWMIPKSALANLVKENLVRLLEATFVTNRYATYEQARKQGEIYLQRSLDAVIDVRESRRQIQSLPSH